MVAAGDSRSAPVRPPTTTQAITAPIRPTRNAHEADRTVPRRPARRRVLGQLRRLGRRGCDGALHVAAQSRDGQLCERSRSPRRRAAAARRARPDRRGSRPRAPPRCPSRASRPRAPPRRRPRPPARARAGRCAGSGFAAAVAAEVTTPSTRSSSPSGASQSGSEQSQLLTTTQARPALAQHARAPAATSGKAVNSSAPSMARRAVGVVEPRQLERLQHDRRRSGRAGRRARSRSAPSRWCSR